MNDRAARAALAAAIAPGSAQVTKEVLTAGPQGVLEALRTGRAGALDRDGRVRRRLAGIDGERVIAAGDAAGARFICPGDPEWPDRLNLLEPTYEFSRRPVPPPFGLWVRGTSNLADLSERSLAIVGARAATTYGKTVAADLAAELATAGWTVVSGAAYGIDGAAHRGALAMNRPTVAVLACGADVVYPRGHAALLDRILADGLIVSERPPGALPTRPGFLQRNRIIAAMTAGTVVVEAALRSGALSTAQWAADLHRNVVAIPGPVTSSMSVGCHKLVRDNVAVLATTATEVADVVGDVGADAVAESRAPDRALDALSPVERDVYEAMPGRGPTSVDRICAETGLTVPACMAALTALTAADLVMVTEDGWRLTGRMRGGA
jgi:DNA processing protein